MTYNATVFNPQTLPSNDNINRFSFCMDVSDEMFIQRGRMIAYYGTLQFESLGSSVIDILVKEAFNAPLFIHDFIVVRGKGKLILGDRGNDIASFDLEGANMTLRADNLLGFEAGLICQEATLPGYVTLLGSGKVLASSNGPVHFLELPCRVDEQALLGWADCPSPSYHYDISYITGVLSAVGSMTGLIDSGEERQVDFTGQGTVLVQSSELERFSGSLLPGLLSQISRLGETELAVVRGAVKRR